MSNSIAPGSSADVNVRVTALTTNPNVPVTYKTIILKKNLVNGVNTLTQEMMSTTNTKYVIKYDYTLGEDITIPANCVLEFDGGSIDGIDSDNTTLNLNNCPLIGKPLIKNCKLTNIYKKEINLSWLGINNSSSAYNTKTLNWLGALELKWIVDTDVAIDDVVTITTRTSIIGEVGDYSYGKYTITAMNSGAIRYRINYLHSIRIANLRVVSDGHCFDFASYTYDSIFENLRLVAYSGDCLHFYDDDTYDSEHILLYNFHNRISHLWVFATTGYGIANCGGRTLIDDVQSGYCLATFKRCYATFQNCNTCYSTKYNKDGTTERICAKHFLYWDGNKTFYGMQLTFINCNAESYTEEPILDEPSDGAVHRFQFNFIQSVLHVYASPTSEKQEIPAIKVDSIDSIFASSSFLSSHDSNVWSDGITPIMTLRSYHPNTNKCDQVGSDYIVSCNGVILGDTNRLPVSSTATYKPVSPAPGYAFYDTQAKLFELWNGDRWTLPNGFSALRQAGNTSQRPTQYEPFVSGNTKDTGALYFDTSIYQPIVFCGNINKGENGWLDMFGFTPAKHNGTTAERPTNLRFSGYQKDQGFCYFDTDLGKPIYAKGTSGGSIIWVDATGATV